MTVNVSICTIMYNSDSRGHLDRFMRQMNALRWPGDHLRLYVVEGDSTDGTYPRLMEMTRHDLGYRMYVFKKDGGAAHLGSVATIERRLGGIKIAAYSRGLGAHDGWSDYVLWVESDLIWDADLLVKLLSCRVEMVSPWIWVYLIGSDKETCAELKALDPAHRYFYDIWAYRYLPDGRNFMDVDHPPNGLMEIYSSGSVLLTTSEIAREHNPETEDAIVGWCTDARQGGHRLWLDSFTEVWHEWPRRA